jgi:uncharacterized membrane protein
MLIIDDILLSPLKGLVFLSKKIDEIIQKEMSDEGKIKERLMELQLRYEMDEISEKEYDRQEEELLNLLEQIRAGKVYGRTEPGEQEPEN